MKVLIVDDHALFREGLVSLFKSQPDFTVVGEADSVNEAVRKASALRPDLVIMDLGLPDGSGMDAMQDILARQPNMKVVFLTIHDSDEQAFAAIRRGAKGFLIKNIPVSKLLTALRALERGEIAVSRTVLSRFINEILRWGQVRGPERAGVGGLTTRELDVLAELSTGASNREIATRLVISENTLKIHIHNILDKLKLRNRKEAAEFALRHGLGRPIYPNNLGEEGPQRRLL